MSCFIKKLGKQTCLINFNWIACTLTCGYEENTLNTYEENEFYEIKQRKI